MNYGYKDSTELTPGKQGGKFGLNVGTVTKFEYNSNAGVNSAALDAIDFTVQISEKEYRLRFFPITKAWSKSGGEIIDTSTKEYKDSIHEQIVQLNATLSDIVKCFVDEDILKKALSTTINSFKNYAEILQRLVQGTTNWDKKLVDVFLQYQWKPTGDNDKTYLELPKNVKQGIFIVKSLGEGFVEQKSENSLRYVNAQGLVHPFKRGEWFLNSAYAKQTNLTEVQKDIFTSGGSSEW